MGSDEYEVLVKPGVPLEEIIKNSSTCDIILFAGTSLESNAIICCQKGKQNIPDGVPIFSHIGVIIKGYDFNFNNYDLIETMRTENFSIDKNETYILEAQMTAKSEQIVGNTKCFCGIAECCTGIGRKCDFWNCSCDKIVYGVLFRKLSDVIKDYDNSADIRIHYGQLQHSKNPFRYKRTEDGSGRASLKYQEAITKSFLTYREIPYDFGCLGINMCAVICRLCRPCRLCITCGNTESAVVCSELVAMVWRDCQIINDDVRTQNVSPMDFLGYETDSHLGRMGLGKSTSM